MNLPLPPGVDSDAIKEEAARLKCSAKLVRTWTNDCKSAMTASLQHLTFMRWLLMDQLRRPLDLQLRVLEAAKLHVNQAQAELARVKSLRPEQTDEIQKARLDLRSELVERVEALRRGDDAALLQTANRPSETRDDELPAQQRVLRDLFPEIGEWDGVDTAASGS
mmetsp:Transcript_49675/g.116758  ORF Transcript_49675/g.116758 Transcript_49675/m.116758 type:complete len:165 (+) Transcript_49675:499-993(+)